MSSLVHLRSTGDLLTGVLILWAFFWECVWGARDVVDGCGLVFRGLRVAAVGSLCCLHCFVCCLVVAGGGIWFIKILSGCGVRAI